ncbi:hypothetical protein RJ640_013634 [Escallonia rubra]|uniref:Uncharacterized protein n=1 Tax=Escallonia rubra TaxID=112253 RepID=A0AA88R885_9ASTE|nr:hypothetical protein RJ640_013634 [Escallonia rubra]
MVSKAIIYLGLLLAIFLLISSEAAARDLAETATKSTVNTEATKGCKWGKRGQVSRRRMEDIPAVDMEDIPAVVMEGEGTRGAVMEGEGPRGAVMEGTLGAVMVDAPVMVVEEATADMVVAAMVAAVSLVRLCRQSLTTEATKNVATSLEVGSGE